MKSRGRLLRTEGDVVLSAQIALDLREGGAQVAGGLRDIKPSAGRVGKALQYPIAAAVHFAAADGQRVNLDFAALRAGDHVAQAVDAVCVIAVAENDNRTMDHLVAAD